MPVEVNPLLSFEWNEDLQTLEIHADAQGLTQLASTLSRLAQRPKSDHDHLMTPDWGGHELSTEMVGHTNKKIHHVKIFSWKDRESSCA